MANKLEEYGIIAGVIIMAGAIAYIGYQIFQKDINNLIAVAQSKLNNIVSPPSVSSTPSNTSNKSTNLSNIYPSGQSSSSNIIPSTSSTSSTSSSTVAIPYIQSQGGGKGALGSETNWYFPYTNGWQGAGYYKSSSQTQPEYISSLSDFEATYTGAPTNSATASSNTTTLSLLGLNGEQAQAQALTQQVSTPDIPSQGAGKGSLGSITNWYFPLEYGWQGAGYYKSAYQSSPVYISSLAEFNSTYG